MRGVTAALSAALLALVTVAVAETALLALVLLFAFVLRLNLTINVGSSVISGFTPGDEPRPDVFIYSGAIVASMLFTAAAGAASSIWTFRRWRATA